MNRMDIEALRECELNLLKQFIGICDDLKLQYYVLGGTLLGAVRHKGFIPWDDDIDIGMPREDYESFLCAAAAYLPGHYFLQTNHTDPEWPANFAKLRDSRTTFIESSVRNQRMHHGVYIDIFPLDYCPQRKLFRFCFDIAERLLDCRIRQAFTLDGGRKAGIKAMVSRMLFPSLRRALKTREKLMRSVKQSGILANYCGAWGKRERVPAEWYGNGTTLEFEGIPVQAPAQYKKWLTKVYGDYMRLPPVEERIAHHRTEVIDLNNPYTAYTYSGRNK